MINLKKRILSCFLLMGVFAVLVQAEDKPIYRVGIEDVDYYPMFTKKGDRYKTSFLIDVMELFAQKRGVKFEYIHLPISRFEEWYQQDSIDFRLPDNPMWNTNTENLVFSGDIIELRADTVVLKKNQHKPVSTLKVLGSLYGFVPGAHWGNHINTGRTKFVFESSMPVLVGLLKREMVDGLDVNLTVVHHHANELRYNTDDFVASTEAPNVQYTYALSTIAHPEIIKDFDAFLVASQNEISLLKQRKDIFDSKQ